jgi:hypothetical protein
VHEPKLKLPVKTIIKLGKEVLVNPAEQTQYLQMLGHLSISKDK